MDIKTVFDAIKAKQAKYTALDGYYHGQQPTVYLTQRLREIFRPLDIAFTENWCSVVIDACDERINLTGFESSDESADQALKAAWERNELANEASDAHTDALVLGESYIIAWPGVDNKAEVFYNDPRMVHVVYSEENPRQVAMAGKLWCGADGKAKMTLYYPDRIEYYASAAKYDQVSSSSAFSPDTSISDSGSAPNPYGQVPVFHLKINRSCISDLINVIPLQNGVNKLLSDMMIAAEYGAFSQRWVISQGDTTALKNAPGEIWSLPAGDGIGQDTQAGQFQSTDLKNYLDAIDRLSLAIGVITRTPKHYFFTSGGDPSGEALIALEAPLNKKAQDRIDRFKPVWRQLGKFICQIEGITIPADAVSPQFQRPETIQPKTQADIIKTSVDSTIPLETALIRAGWSEDEIEAMKTVRDEESSKAKTGLANALLAAQQEVKNQAMPTGGTMPQGNNQNPMIPQGAPNGSTQANFVR